MKASAILVQLTEPLENLPAGEVDSVRRFLFQRMRGLDAEQHRRWCRFWNRIVRGEVGQFYPVVERSGPFHARHMAIEDRLFENQDGFVPNAAGRRAFRNWLKCGASLVRLEINDGEAKWLPGSIGYEDLSDDEMRSFHEAAIDWLRTPSALKKLWPAMKPDQRAENLELLLRNPEEKSP